MSHLTSWGNFLRTCSPNKEVAKELDSVKDVIEVLKEVDNKTAVKVVEIEPEPPPGAIHRLIYVQQIVGKEN